MSAITLLARWRARREDPWARYDPQAVIGDLNATPGRQEDRRSDVPVHRFAPDALSAPGRLSPLAAPVEADLNGNLLFRDTVRSIAVRAEPHHGCGRTFPALAGQTWPERYAAILEHRTEVPAAALIAPDYGVAAAFDRLETDMREAFRQERLDVASGLTWAEAHADAGFSEASRMFHSERELMTGRAA